jgi:hypothetical protein
MLESAEALKLRDVHLGTQEKKRPRAAIRPLAAGKFTPSSCLAALRLKNLVSVLVGCSDGVDSCSLLRCVVRHRRGGVPGARLAGLGGGGDCHGDGSRGPRRGRAVFGHPRELAGCGALHRLRC